MTRRPRRILDAHHHFWDLKAGHYPWLDDAIDPDFFLGDYAAFREERMLPDGYRAASQGFNVVGTVHCEAERDRNDQVGETRWLADLNRRDGLPTAIVGHVWFDDPRCLELLAAHKAASPLVCGIRSKPVTAKRPQDIRRGGPRTMQDDAWLRGFALLDTYDLSWDLRVPFWHLPEAAEVAKAFPRTPIVLNHTGFPWDRSPDGLRAWRAAMEPLAACPNVWLKVSELGVKGMRWTVEGNRGVVRDAIEMFGRERAMFATNWPVCTLTVAYDALVDGICEILGDFSDDDLDAVFCRNAATFYRVDLADT